MRIKLGQAFELQMGKTPARNNPAFWNGENKWVTIADLSNNGKYVSHTKEKITDEGARICGMKKVPKGTVIMSFKLSIGKAAITTENIYTNEAIIAFINKGIIDIDTDYLYHLCISTDWSFGTNKAVKGLTLNKSVLSGKEVSIPEISIQREIASKLDCIDSIISDRRKQIRTLDQLVKSRFIGAACEI